MKYLTNIDLNKNELQNARIQNLATAPSNPVVGQIYFNTTDKLLYNWDGTNWKAVGSDAPVTSVAGKTGDVTLVKGDVGLGNVDNTSDANKPISTATQTALNAKLSLSGGTMSGAIAMGGNKITGLDTPTANTDASTKKYVDDQISGLGAVLTFKGTKATASELPASGNHTGDMWIVTADNSEYVWNGTDWEKLGPTMNLPTPSDTTPKMDGTANKGSETTYARGDHVHPTDTTLAPKASPALTGTPTAPTATAGTNTTQIATTAFVQTAVATKTKVNSASGTISTNATSVEVTNPGSLIHAYAVMAGEIVAVDIVISSGKVTFSTAAKPSSAITCYVLYM